MSNITRGKEILQFHAINTLALIILQESMITISDRFYSRAIYDATSISHLRLFQGYDCAKS